MPTLSIGRHLLHPPEERQVGQQETLVEHEVQQGVLPKHMQKQLQKRANLTLAAARGGNICHLGHHSMEALDGQGLVRNAGLE